MLAGRTLFRQKGPAFLSTLEHLSPAGSWSNPGAFVSCLGAVYRKPLELPVQRTFSGQVPWTAARPST